MNIIMECNSLSVTGLEDSFAICFGAMEDDELQEYVMLQTSFDEEQTSNDQIYLEINDQSCSTYGGILKCVLNPENLTFYVTDSAASELGLDAPGEMQIKLQLDEEQVEELTLALNEVVFQNQDTLEIQDL